MNKLRTIPFLFFFILFPTIHSMSRVNIAHMSVTSLKNKKNKYIYLARPINTKFLGLTLPLDMDEFKNLKNETSTLYLRNKTVPVENTYKDKNIEIVFFQREDNHLEFFFLLNSLLLNKSTHNFVYLYEKDTTCYKSLLDRLKEKGFVTQNEYTIEKDLTPYEDEASDSSKSVANNEPEQKKYKKKFVLSKEKQIRSIKRIAPRRPHNRTVFTITTIVATVAVCIGSFWWQCKRSKQS